MNVDSIQCLAVGAVRRPSSLSLSVDVDRPLTYVRYSGSLAYESFGLWRVQEILSLNVDTKTLESISLPQRYFGSNSTNGWPGGRVLAITVAAHSAFHAAKSFLTSSCHRNGSAGNTDILFALIGRSQRIVEPRKAMDELDHSINDCDSVLVDPSNAVKRRTKSKYLSRGAGRWTDSERRTFLVGLQRL
jgi:hypothetical protein